MPVFLTSIGTILGVILFLRFGYAVGHAGLGGALAIIAAGHLVTIPTVLAVAEIATNRRVAGGGAYYIISRSFGIGIGGSTGIVLYLAQAISTSFYLVAFTEAVMPAIEWSERFHGIAVPSHWVGVFSAALLLALILAKGTALGVRALWTVCAILAVSICAFLFGRGDDSIRPDGMNLTARIANPDSFGTVFATCFPAFTGMIAGLGLSGDLKTPQKSIPQGTIGATLAGMVVYVLVAVKLAASATPEALAADAFIMTRIALWGPAIYIGLAAASLSSAVGSILVAPRTLQALAKDNVFGLPRLNRLLAQGKGKSQDPVAATLATGAIVLVFVYGGSLDSIAQLLSQFFLATYGALCAVSFLEHFAGNPSYRPTFSTRWYVSLIGALMCAMMMIRISVLYALLAAVVMLLFYIGLRRTRRGEGDLAAIFQGAMYQLTRKLRIVLQRKGAETSEAAWRPSFIALTRFSEGRLGQFDLLRWLCYRQGFGHFIIFIQGEYSYVAELEARMLLDRIIERSEVSRAGIYVDTLISPSFGLALSQTLQAPGISGLRNNSVLLEFDQDSDEEAREVMSGARTAAESMFNAVVLRSSKQRFGYRSNIHVWCMGGNQANASLMLLLAYIVVGHPDWKKADIRMFVGYDPDKIEREADKLPPLLRQGRLPIAKQNIEAAPCPRSVSMEVEAMQRSASADLLLVELPRERILELDHEWLLKSYSGAQDVVFVYASERIPIG